MSHVKTDAIELSLTLIFDKKKFILQFISIYIQVIIQFDFRGNDDILVKFDLKGAIYSIVLSLFISPSLHYLAFLFRMFVLLYVCHTIPTLNRLADVID